MIATTRSTVSLELEVSINLESVAPGSNGIINFIADVTLSGTSTKIIAADTVKIFDAIKVTIGGVNPASVFTNHAHYTGFGGDNTTTGTFAGAGATTSALAGAPHY